ncbi:MAG: hypothetical protein AAGI88_12945 [Pseudomonadota bacterium]
MPLEDWVSRDAEERARVEPTVEIYGPAYAELFQYHPTDPDIGECFLRLVADGDKAKFEHFGPHGQGSPFPQWNKKWLELTKTLRLAVDVRDGEEILASKQNLPVQLGISNWQVTEWLIKRRMVNGRFMLEEEIFWKDADDRLAQSKYRWFPY